MTEPSATAETELAPWLQHQLLRLLTQRGHAWLLHGPAGLGQYPLALALARAWLCENPGVQGLACGHCASCHAIDVRTHADLAVLMPEALALELGWPLGEKAQKELDDKKRKPSREIRVEALRETIEFSQRSDARGRGKVVLVYPAERMNAICANALLKTLEEPAGSVRFLLASESASALPATIRSRCQSHALAWPKAQEMQDWLVRLGLANEQAEALLKASGGRPEQALAWAHTGLSASDWDALPRLLAQGQAGAMAAWPPARVLDTLQKLCHDALAQAVGAQPRYFAAASLPKSANLARLSAWAADLRALARHIEHPFAPALLLESLLAQAQQALQPTTPAARRTSAIPA